MGSYSFILSWDFSWENILADQLRGLEAVWPVQCGDGSFMFFDVDDGNGDEVCQRQGDHYSIDRDVSLQVQFHLMCVGIWP